MAEYVKCADVTDIQDGTMKTVQVAGKLIALARIDGQVFAIDDTCTHAECSLGTHGFLEEDAVFCGCHGAKFDIKTGDVLSPPATQAVATYPVRIQSDGIYICL